MLTSPFEVRALATAALIVLAVLAAREDLLRHRIPNALNGMFLVLGLGLAALAGGWAGLASSIAGAAIGCAMLIPFYLLRGMGAADVKLMAVAGAFLGPRGAFIAAVLALVFGLAMAVALVLWRVLEARQPVPVTAADVATAPRPAAATISKIRKERFPYAMAIGAGVLAALWLQGWLKVLSIALGIQ